jgi:hypothetical protein
VFHETKNSDNEGLFSMKECPISFCFTLLILKGMKFTSSRKLKNVDDKKKRALARLKLTKVRNQRSQDLDRTLPAISTKVMKAMRQ